MSKRNRNRNKGKETLTVAEPDQKMQAFTFGEPSAVLDRREILDYTECVGNGKWIEPPISFSGLAKSLRAPFTTARRFM